MTAEPFGGFYESPSSWAGRRAGWRWPRGRSPRTGGRAAGGRGASRCRRDSARAVAARVHPAGVDGGQAVRPGRPAHVRAQRRGDDREGVPVRGCRAGPVGAASGDPRWSPTSLDIPASEMVPAAPPQVFGPEGEEAARTRRRSVLGLGNSIRWARKGRRRRSGDGRGEGERCGGAGPAGRGSGSRRPLWRSRSVSPGPPAGAAWRPAWRTSSRRRCRGRRRARRANRRLCRSRPARPTRPAHRQQPVAAVGTGAGRPRGTGSWAVAE